MRYMRCKLLLVLVFFLIATVFSGCVDDTTKTITVFVNPDGSGDFISIQDAIDGTEESTTIRVAEGVYYESLVIDKKVTILGNDSTSTIIDGGGIGDVIKAVSEKVHLSGLTIQNSGRSELADFDAAIEIKANNTKVDECILKNCIAGIDLRSYSNSISNCVFIDNLFGVYAIESFENVFSGNEFKRNSQVGLFIFNSMGNEVKNGNRFVDNAIGLQVRGSKHNIINDNIFSDNEKGLYICCVSSDNSMFGNSFLHNSLVHAEDTVEYNIWYDPQEKQGNYWDDYVGVDADGNGIGDSAYIISDSKEIYDLYPLINNPSIS